VRADSAVCAANPSYKNTREGDTFFAGRALTLPRALQFPRVSEAIPGVIARVDIPSSDWGRQEPGRQPGARQTDANGKY